MDLPYSEACERNQAPILEWLLEILPQRGRVLEVGSGTGQHVVHFAPAFNKLSWQPSEREESLEGLNARIRAEAPANVLPAILLDVRAAWPHERFDACYSANTAHIMSWAEIRAMFAGVGTRLRPGAPLCIYGPFKDNGTFTSESNRLFDQDLRSRNPDMGLRDIRDLEALAQEHDMRLAARHAMPANNLLLVFTKNGLTEDVGTDP